MTEKDPIESIARNWNRILYLAKIDLLPIANIPVKFK